MQLSLLVAVVATIMVSENSVRAPVESVGLRIGCATGAMLTVVFLAAFGSLTISRAIRLDPSRRATWLHWFMRLQQVHLVVWLAVVGIIVYLLRWPQLVQFNWGFDSVVLLKDLVVLSPVWLPLLLSWSVFYEVERATHETAPQIAVHLEPQPAKQCPGRIDFLWLHVRHFLGLSILPLLCLLAFHDAFTFMQPDWQHHQMAWLVSAVPLVVLLLLFPQLLSRIWQTSSLPAGPLRSRLDVMTRKMGVRCRDFRIWKTDGRVLNAAVAGLVPAMRYVFVTDGLLRSLREDELESIVAHELGHVQRRHLLFRMLLLTLPLWVIVNIQVCTPELASEWANWLSSAFSSQLVLKGIVLPGITLAYAAISLGYYSRMLEHDADLCVYEEGHAQSFITTIDRLSYLSRDQREKRTWLHPSTIARIRLLQRASSDPHVAKILRRKVNRCNHALLTAWIATPIVLMLV